MCAHKHVTVVSVPAVAESVFAFVDDHSRLSSHMSDRSWMMGGGRMSLEMDAGHGKGIGSRLRLHGKAFGISLSLEEVVTERVPPLRKVWETVGEPKLLVVGSYRMGVQIAGRGATSELCVFIEYNLPARAPWRWMGQLFGRRYASWCTARMANDALRHFSGAG